MNDRSIFCKNIQRLMDENNLTIKEMAEIMDVKECIVEQLCQNIIPSDLYVDSLFNLCVYFNLTPSDFLN